MFRLVWMDHTSEHFRESWIRFRYGHDEDGTATPVVTGSVLQAYVWANEASQPHLRDLTTEEREALDPILAETLLALEYARNPPYGDIE